MGATEHRYRVRKLASRLLVEDRLLLRLGDAAVKLEPYEGVNRLIFERLSEPTTRSGLLEAAAEHGRAGRQRAAEVFDRLLEGGFLERCDLNHDLHAHDVERFDRFLHWLSGFEDAATTRFDLLRRLRDADVMVIGTGGMGSWVVYNLLCCGVGRLTLVDGDVVEPSNLNRSILYRERDVGRSKVEVARERALEFAPRTEVATLQRMILDPVDLDGRLDGRDLVVSTADQPPWVVKHRVAEACHRARVPLLTVMGFHVGPFFTPEGPGAAGASCPMCEWAHMIDRDPRQRRVLRDQERVPRQDVGALAHYGSITAGVASHDAVRFLVGAAPSTRGAVWHMDARLTARVTPVERHARCAVCGDRSPGYGLLETEEAMT